MAKLESLVVDLQVNTAQLRQGLDQAKEHLKGFGDRVKELGEQLRALTELAAVEFGKGLLESGVELTKKLGEFVIGGAEAADTMGKIAAAAQVPVEEFQRLAYAARLGGVSTEDLGGSFNKLNRALGEATAGSAKQSALFQALGVNLKNSSGVARDSADIFRELAGKLGEMAPGYAKADLEQQLFGKSGTQLDAVLKNVAEGMADAGGEAEKFGLVLSGNAIAAATEFHDNVEKIELAINGVATRVAANLAPALSQLTDEFLKSKSGAEGLDRAVADITTAIKGLVSVALGLVAAFEAVNQSMSGVVLAAIAAFSGEFKLAGSIIEATAKTVKDTVADAGNRIKGVWEANQKTFEDAAGTHKKMADSVLADQKRIEGSAAEMKKRLEEAYKLAEHLANQHFKEAAITAKTGEVDQKSAEISLQFRNIGADPTAALQRALDGFKSFDEALEAYTASQKNILAAELDVETAKANLDVEGFDEATARLEMEKSTSEELKRVLDAFKGLKTDEIDKAAQAMQRMRSFIEGELAKLVGKMGDLGSVIQTGIEGFKQGGWWGAIIAVVVDLLSKFEGFSKVIDQANGVLKDLIGSMSKGLGAVTQGISQLLRGLEPLFNAIGSLLNGPLQGFGIMLTHIGDALKAVFGGGLGDALGVLGDFVSTIMDIIQSLDVMRPILKLLGALFDIAGGVLSYLLGSLQKFIADVLEGIRQALATIGQLGGPLGDVANKAALDISGFENKLQAGADAAKAKGDAAFQKLGHVFDDVGDNLDTSLAPVTKAANASAAALDKWTSSITNAPSGFRIDALRFNATATVGGGHVKSGDIHLHFSGGVMTTVDQIRDAVAKGLLVKHFHKHGV